MAGHRRSSSGQAKSKASASLRAVGRPQPPAVVLYDAARHDQAQAEAGLLAARKGGEQSRHHLRGDPGAGVLDTDLDFANAWPEADLQTPAARQRVQGVEHQVDKYLSQLLAIGLDRHG